MKRLVFDLDGTLTKGAPDGYELAIPNIEMIQKLKYYKQSGFEIIISTARNMRSYEANIGKINKHTLPTIVAWLDRHNIPYDEIHIGKPWNGMDGFYIDDKAIRPSEFLNLSYDQIKSLLDKEK